MYTQSPKRMVVFATILIQMQVALNWIVPGNDYIQFLPSTVFDSNLGCVTMVKKSGTECDQTPLNIDFC